MNRPMMHLVDPQTGESNPADIRRVFDSQEATAIAWRESTIAERIARLKKLRDASGIALEAMMFIGDAIFPGGNDYPAKELGLDTVRVRDPQETLSVIAAIVACIK